MWWQCHQLDLMQIICISLHTRNHTSTSSLNNYLQTGCSSWRTTNSVKALKAIGDPNVTMAPSRPLLYSTVQYNTITSDNVPRWLRNDMHPWWPFRSFPVIRRNRRPRQMIGYDFLFTFNSNQLYFASFSRYWRRKFSASRTVPLYRHADR